MNSIQLTPLHQIVSKESATFGLAGTRENIVRLNADHGGLCRFGENLVDQDNYKLVKGNLKELYRQAVRNGELLQLSVPSTNVLEERVGVL